MSVVIYRGDDEIEKIYVEAHQLTDHLMNGWRVTPETSYENGKDDVQEEAKTTENGEEEIEQLRQKAKAAGIGSWHLKAPETLRQEFADLEG